MKEILYCEKKDFDYLRNTLKKIDEVVMENGYAHALGVLIGAAKIMLEHIEITTKIERW
jgi:hypothetical protein